MNVYCLEYPQKKIIKRYRNKIKFIYVSDNSFIPSNAKIIYCKLNYLIDKKIINPKLSLKYILSPTTSLNHIDLRLTNEKKIKILNLNPKSKDIKLITSTGEYTISLILSSVRRLFSFTDTPLIDYLKKRYLFNIFQFRNYTVGIIGLGRIGSYLNNHLKSLAFKTITYDKKTDKVSKLNELLKKSDIISINIDSKNNHNFFNKKKFNLMKKNVIIINTSRGEVVDEKDLILFLKQNPDSFAILDVIKNEQKQLDKNLLLEYKKKYKNLIIFPHLGGSTKDAMEIADDYVFKKLLKIYEKKN